MIPHERDPPPGWGRRRLCYSAVGAALVAALATAAWHAHRPNPNRLLEQARACARRDPEHAERLLSQSIAAMPGGFPEAEMALCLLRARRGDWDGALSLYRGLNPAD